MAFKRALVDKVDVYDKIISVLIEGGWTNLTSKGTPPAGDVVLTNGADCDWDVMRSPSGSIYQLRPFLSANETAVNHTIVLANDTRVGDKCSLSVRMLSNYEPSEEPGTQGVCTPATVPWMSAHTYATEAASPGAQVCANTVTNIDFLYDVNASTAIFVFRYPAVLGKKCSFLYFGMPESVRGNRLPEYDSIFASTMMQGLTGSHLRSINYPEGVGDVLATAYLDNDTQLMLPLKNPSYLKEYWLTPIYWGTAAIGMRGRLDGIYALAANIGLMDRDQITVGSKVYEVVELAIVSTNCSFNAGWIAIELDTTPPVTPEP